MYWHIFLRSLRASCIWIQCFSILILSSMLDDHVFQFGYCHPRWMIMLFNLDIVSHVGWSCCSISILSSMLDHHVFQFWCCHPYWIIMFFNFDVVIYVGWSCFSMYFNWYGIKHVCSVLFTPLTFFLNISKLRLKYLCVQVFGMIVVF